MNQRQTLTGDTTFYTIVSSLKKKGLCVTGLAETSTREDTEALLHSFIKDQLPSVRHKLPFSFERVHRLGNSPPQSGGYPRPIVAKFSFHKDRELVRNSGRDLRGTNYGIREQFPYEVHQRRKKLQPKLKEAKSNNLRASLHRDTLRVENQTFRVNGTGNVYQVDTTHNHRNTHYQQAKSSQHTRQNNAIPLHNRFGPLSDTASFGHPQTQQRQQQQQYNVHNYVGSHTYATTVSGDHSMRRLGGQLTPV